MPLTGELSDLSLAELIEFFCNQRKTGRLEVIYPKGCADFYLHCGSVVHAQIGTLRGIEAVYYSLTLSNASFVFNSTTEVPPQTINQPWTSVVLEGLRRLDEGIAPPNPFPEETAQPIDNSELIDQTVGLVTVEPAAQQVEEKPLVIETADDANQEKLPHVSLDHQPEAIPAITKSDAERGKANDDVPVIDLDSPGILSLRPKRSKTVSPIFAEVESAGTFAYGPMKLSAIFGAVVLIVAVIAVPWGWYARSKAARLNSDAQRVTTEAAPPSVIVNPTPNAEAPVVSDSTAATTEPAMATEQTSAVANRPTTENPQRESRPNEWAKPKPIEAAPTTSKPATAETNPAVRTTQPPPLSAPKRVTVQVTYDENGRVTQASGGDATALRIARQKRFPAGKAGSATVTIPIN